MTDAWEPKAGGRVFVEHPAHSFQIGTVTHVARPREGTTEQVRYTIVHADYQERVAVRATPESPVMVVAVQVPRSLYPLHQGFRRTAEGAWVGVQDPLYVAREGF